MDHENNANPDPTARLKAPSRGGLVPRAASQSRPSSTTGRCRAICLDGHSVLLPAGAVSCWHRVIGGDEIWTHIDGATLELFQCQGDGTGLKRDALHASNPIQVVPANTWQAARSLGDYSLMSCCVGPGFEFCDFEMARQNPATERPKLPHSELI